MQLCSSIPYPPLSGFPSFVLHVASYSQSRTALLLYLVPSLSLSRLHLYLYLGLGGTSASSSRATFAPHYRPDLRASSASREQIYKHYASPAATLHSQHSTRGSCLNSGASLVAVSLKVFTHKHGSCRIFLRAQDELQDRDARRLRRAGSLGISSASESHIGTATTPRTEMVLHRASYRLVNHATVRCPTALRSDGFCTDIHPWQRMPDVTLSPALQ
ncbi:hypothetical protein OH76DRAFT_1521734, partial [Lentinus brumalis]